MAATRARPGEVVVYGLGMLLGAALIAFGAVKAYRFLYPTYREPGTIEGACDLHAGACRAVLPDGARLSFSITPRPIPLITPLDVEVRISGLTPDAIEVDFSSLEMNMGFNRPALAKEGAGVFRGKAVLPACVSERMTWRARVLMHTSDGTLAVPFTFVTTGARTAG